MAARAMKTQLVFVQTQAQVANNSAATADARPAGADGERDYVLDALFKDTSMHSAMCHDTVLKSGTESTLVVREAQKIAKLAGNALKRSFEEMGHQRPNLAVPTWTGRFGQAGAPRFGQTSSAGKALSTKTLLAHIRDQDPNIDPGAEADLSRPQDAEAVALMRQLRAFIKKRGGSVTTNTLLKGFQSQIPATKSASFKFMLKEICLLDKKTSSWTLREGFQ